MARRTRPVFVNRITRVGTMTAAELRAHPKNPRVHSAAQKAAMRAMMDKHGFIGALLVNERTGLMLDGHLRADISDDTQTFTVLFCDLDPDEEAEVLLLLDSIGAMADYDETLTRALANEVSLEPDLQAAIDPYLSVDTPDRHLEPDRVDLRPLNKAYVFISIPLDQWPYVAELIDQLQMVEGVHIATSTR